MKIAFDISPLYDDNKYRGVGVYTKHLLEEVPKLDPKLTYLPFKKNDKIPMCDIVHYPYFDPFFLTLPLKKKYPVVVTVHDMIPFVFPKNFPRGVKGEVKWQIQKRSLKNANAILTDSICSKNDIVKFTGIDMNKINVVYLSGSLDIHKNISYDENNSVRQKYKLPPKFLLYVGDLNFNKNVFTLLKALMLLNDIKDLQLVIVGGAFVNYNLLEKQDLDTYITKLGITKRITFTGRVTDQELSELYSLAYAYIHPSLYEGFGIPVLDAMVAGCPVLTSESGSLKEIVGENAILFDPNDSNSISSAIRKIYQYSNKEYTIIKEKGIENTKRFSWQKTAKETIAVYKGII